MTTTERRTASNSVCGGDPTGPGGLSSGLPSTGAGRQLQYRHREQHHLEHHDQQQQHHHHHHHLLDPQSQPSTPDPNHQYDGDNPTHLLDFADVSTDLARLHLSPPDLEHHGRADILSSSDPSRPGSRSSNSSHPHRQPPPQASLPPAPASAIRKTSPGLAARLKALGFGTAKTLSSPTTPSPHDTIGRLDEDQLRQLDEKHQAGSLTDTVVRRGRPWKGLGGIPSDRDRTSAHRPDPARLQPPASVQAAVTAASEPQSPSSPLPGSDTGSELDASPQLPEIKTPEPLAMDTNKYRLPDHTNGNGAKFTPETRREHIERDISTTVIPENVDATPPPPPPKDSPPVGTPSAQSEAADYVPGLGSYFTAGGNRPGSIYTLSRASFANQLAQLTSLQLPDAGSLSSKVSAIPSAQIASKALINAAEQIRSWISKASEVIAGLDSDDDVEWSAAGGREGLDEVENAIGRFEDVINVYVGAIEQLQARRDISAVSPDDLKRAVSQMESIVQEWAKIRNALNNVRGQVEIAMEWEELWNNVLGDIQGEMDELSRLVFEMEERRHKSIAAAASGDGVDIGDLETIVEDTPPPQATRLQAQTSRLSIPGLPMSPGTPGTPGAPSLSQDDSSLLALFARMQPLRASLDFLPMRLSVFQTRAEHAFPTACDELEMRRTGLDASYRKLETDAESLRKELGEDRWVIVFRGAGRQAQKMLESVERSLLKLREAIDAGMQLTNASTLAKKLESYEAKKTHYGPAIERVLSIIDKGVKDRLTVNGEILRLDAELQAKWTSLKEQIHGMDGAVDELHADARGQQLRDSISSMLSNDRSTVGSGHETPGSSPPSSVIMSSLGVEPFTPGSSKRPKTRSPSVHGSVPSNRRHSSLPAPVNSVTKKLSSSRLSTIASSSTATTPVPGSRAHQAAAADHRPKWNGSTNTSGIDTGHNFKPLSATTPSPYSARSILSRRSAASVTPSSAGSRLPMARSPLARATSESPQVDDTPTRTGPSRLSFRERLAAPGAVSHQKLQKARQPTQLSTPPTTTDRRASFHPPRAASAMADTRPGRPASSLASSARRSSLLPQPRARRESGGATSPQNSTSRLPFRKKDPHPKDTRPAWRP